MDDDDAAPSAPPPPPPPVSDDELATRSLAELVTSARGGPLPPPPPPPDTPDLVEIGDEEEVPRPARGRHRSPTRNLVEWGVLLVLALVAALLIKTFLVQAFYIPSGSMQPTLKKGDRVLVNKLAYRLGDPHRGDVVVFERPPSEPETEVKDLIKRIIALPGETITTDEIGRILVDGKALDESGYLPEGALSTTRIPEQRIPDDHYWVMGDNRGQSKDSRVFGPISRSLLVGKAFVRVWPLSDFSGL